MGNWESGVGGVQAGGWYRKCKGGQMKRANECFVAAKTHNYTMNYKEKTGQLV